MRTEDIGERTIDIFLQGAGAVPEAEGIDPVKNHAGPAIPEIIGVKHGIDHRRGVSGFTAPEIFIFPAEIAQVEIPDPPRAGRDPGIIRG